MRITSWNCQAGKPVNRCLRLLGLPCADLVTLQECRRPPADKRTKIIWQYTDPNQCVDEVSTQTSLQRDTAHKVIWQGIKTSTNGGVAVVSTQAAPQIEFVKIPFLHRTVVPVYVHTPEPFLFVGVWTHPEPSYPKVAWEAMSACANEANKRGLPLVAAGDFNISPCVTGQKRSAPKFVKYMEDKLDLVSAYHHDRDKTLGKETDFTYYEHKKKCKPFHLDYCFVPRVWCEDKNIVQVKVEPFDAFEQSDHRPIIVELKDEIFGISSRS